MPDAREEVLELNRRQEEAVRNGDAATIVADFADDAVSYDLPPPLEVRGAVLRNTAGLEQWFDTWDGPVTVAMKNPTVLVEGDLAVMFGLSRMQGKKKEGEAVDSWSRRTVVLKRIGGAWKIVHEHTSFPTAMDGSNLSVTDAKPED